MSPPIDFEWDDAKAASNLAVHGISFEAAIGIFLDAGAIVLDATRAVDGEERRKVIGEIEGRIFSVVYTMRGRVCRIISARRTNAKEDQAYGDRDGST